MARFLSKAKDLSDFMAFCFMRVFKHVDRHIWRYVSFASYLIFFRILGKSRVRNLAVRSGGSRHIVVCFFGIDRALEYTSWAITQNILKPLISAGMDVTVVGHFNSVRTINSSNSRESSVSRSRDSIRFLDCDVLWIEPQTPDHIEAELKQLGSAQWKEDLPQFKNALRNLLYQLHSLSRCRDILEMTGLDQANLFLILRADLRYRDQLRVFDMLHRLGSGECDLIVPDWQAWGGLNDRFAFLNKRALLPILGRRREVESFAKEHGYLHAEELLQFTADKHNLKVGFTSLRAQRIRSGGRIDSDW